MKSNYKRLGQYIRQIDVRNTDCKVQLLLGVSIEKRFIESIANTIGTDMSTYKVVRKNQFAYGPVTSRNGDKVSIALLDRSECIISSSYYVFEITKPEELLPEYLMLWFKRPEFDRYARFNSHGSAREIFDWNEMCNVELPVPSIREQQKIVDSYNAIEKRISILRQINDNLEAQAQLLFQEYINSHNLKDTSLLDIATIRYGKGLSTQELLPSGYPVFGGNGIIGYFSRYLYELPQIIISCRGVASGKVLESYPYSFITSNSLIVELKDRSLYEWVKRSLLNTSLDECVTGSAQPQITIDNLKNITLPMPCDDSYMAFVSWLASISLHCYNLQMECVRLKQAQTTAITKLLNE